MLLSRVLMPHELAVVATEYYRRAIRLMLEYVLIDAEFFAAAISIAALKAYFSEEIPCDSVDLVKLGVAPAEGAVIRVLGEPVSLAVGADGFLADLALERILENVVADSADKFGKKRSHISLVVNEVLLVHERRLAALRLQRRARTSRGTTKQLNGLLLLRWVTSLGQRRQLLELTRQA